MCGRARAGLRPEAVAEAAGCDEWLDRDRYHPRENAAPGATLPVVFAVAGGRRRQRREAGDGTATGAGAEEEPASGGAAAEWKEATAGASPPADADADDRGADGPSPPRKALRTMRWGLVPFFTRPAPDGSGRPAGSAYDHFNSRAERVREQPLTRRLFGGGPRKEGAEEEGARSLGAELGAQQCSPASPASPHERAARPPGAAGWANHRRGVAIVQGFYEWKGEGAGNKRKQGYYVQLRGGAPMRMAVVWDTWSGGTKGKDGSGGAGGGGDAGGGASAPLPLPLPLHSFSIITVDASRELRWLHDRQPAILVDEAAVDAWLGADTDAAERALASVGGTGREEGGGKEDGGGDVFFEWWPVTSEMNAPSYAGKDAAVDVRKKRGTITSFFAASPSPKRAKLQEDDESGKRGGEAGGGGGGGGANAGKTAAEA